METNLTLYDTMLELKPHEIERDIINLFLACLRSAEATSSAWTSLDITHEATDIRQFTDWERVQRAVAEAIQSRGRADHAIWSLSDLTPEVTESEKIYDVIESLYLSENRPRDRQIAERIIALHRDALE
ncbi:MAG: hypothetical protein MN733_24945, partial [Nitrososphaera sp.]|nr:hypothetical protein [Nitrososphaera sp.]